jgi:hypothetical protein
MATVTVTELAASLEQLQAQMGEISRQMEVLEKRNAVGHGPDGSVGMAVQPVAVQPVVTEPAPAAITEEELLAISAAIGAYLGVRAHIRQIRLVGTSLVGTSAWALQGRVSIQASHRLQG